VVRHSLEDGRAVDIRPIQPEDAQRLQSAHTRLSPESRYRRFLGVKPTLTAEDARYLAEIDGCDHFALVATTLGDGHKGDPSIIAVARFVRLSDDPDVAEFAIVVGDSYQRQGLATELLGRLAAAATARGISRFRATILSDNEAIYKLMQRLSAGQLEVKRRGSISDVEFPLPGAVRSPPRPDAPAIIAACAGS
jgi:RimJ/RimL family protein N-acetyltransferase